MPPNRPPLGLQLATSARTVGRAFNDALAAAGGSIPIWLVLATLRGEEWRTQHELARAIGIEGPTLTRHLDGMERAGLVVRRRAPGDRRAIQVELTERGEELHGELLTAVIAFNKRLRRGLSETDLDQLTRMLTRLAENAGS
ncbi:MAG TPA: MarR family transcriptional regulator [Gaiellales bacterium]|jgi:MarR family transcriptional regulator for hemolysin|nr:MarR family transcriptional regulator [Gaiellales bacterium]